MTENSTPKMTGQYSYAVGKRKTSIATMRLYHKGSGRYFVNGQEVRKYFDIGTYVSRILEPLKLVGLANQCDWSCQVEGGGKSGQADAIRLALSRALLEKEGELRPTLKKSGYLTRDARVKERKKPGLKRARRSPQWSKR